MRQIHDDGDLKLSGFQVFGNKLWAWTKRIEFPRTAKIPCGECAYIASPMS